MQIIPVIDLLGGQVVRGIGGRRSEYRPIESQLVAGSDPGAIAAAFVERFGATTCYAADLDAIEQGDFQVDAWKAIAAAGMKLWLDAGFGECAQLARAIDSCNDAAIDADFIIGSETLESEEQLPMLAWVDFPERLIYSLDMKQRRPLTRIAKWQSLAPLEIAGRMYEGQSPWRMIVLDLADVGTGGGTRTLDLCRELKAKHPQIELIAGGGVRNLDDLKRIADAGCSGALVASALHDGRLTRADWDAAAKL
jgi:phosphoribosylformimino-5-aminoimidazole carboxamide ribotide isomerase